MSEQPPARGRAVGTSRRATKDDFFASRRRSGHSGPVALAVHPRGHRSTTQSNQPSGRTYSAVSCDLCRVSCSRLLRSRIFTFQIQYSDFRLTLARATAPNTQQGQGRGAPPRVRSRLPCGAAPQTHVSGIRPGPPRLVIGQPLVCRFALLVSLSLVSFSSRLSFSSFFSPLLLLFSGGAPGWCATARLLAPPEAIHVATRPLGKSAKSHELAW